MQITESLFLACCQCPYKAYLKSKGEVGKVLDYEAIQTEADARFSEQAVERRKGISLLRFLLSGETDLEKFVKSYRR